MKRFIIFILLLLPLLSFSQSNARIKNLNVTKKVKMQSDVTIGSSSFDASAVLGITSTTKGLLIPRMTTGQRDAIGSPTTSLMIYNSTDNEFQFFETTWQAIGGAGAVGDSSFVTLQWDTAKAFNNTNLQFVDSAIFQEHLQADKSFTVNLGLSTLKGIDATSSNFALKVQDNIGTDLFSIINDNRIGIGSINPFTSTRLFIKGIGNTASTFALIVRNSDNDELFSINDNGAIGIGKISTDATSLILKEKQHIIFENTSVTTSDILWKQSGTVQAVLQYTHAQTRFDIFVGGQASVDRVMTLFAGGDVGIGTTSSIPSARLHVIGDVLIDSLFSITTKTRTLGSAVTTFVAVGNKIKLTGDGGSNTIATITGGIDGMTLTLTFVDALITLTDDNTSTANTINLSAAFTSTANDILVLEFDGTSWREVSRSVN